MILIFGIYSKYGQFLDGKVAVTIHVNGYFSNVNHIAAPMISTSKST